MYPHPAALLLRLLLSLCGIGFAVGFPIAYGLKESYSQYFEVDPVIFCCTLVLLSVGLFMHKNPRWLVPACSLMLVAAFDMFSMPIIHYTAAFIFFIFSSVAMYDDKRIGGFGRTSFALYPLLIFDLIYFEFVQVILLCLFHIFYIIKTFMLMVRKNS